MGFSLFYTLADVAPAATQTNAGSATTAPADGSPWSPSSHDIGVGVGIGVSMLLAAVLLLIPLRRMIERTRLGPTYFILSITSAAFFGLFGMHPPATQMHWFNRLYAGALTYVALRLFDRLMIVPVLTRGGRNKLPRFMHQVILIALTLLTALLFGKEAFGWPIDEVLTAGGVLSIVLGLALQESLGNLFSGLMMQASPPFAIGDYISTGEVEGRVTDMTWRAVTIHTNEDNYVIVPNGNIAKQNIINYEAPTHATARIIKVGLEYDLPPCDAVDVLQLAARETDGVLSNPAPIALLLDFADSSIVYGVKFWIGDAHAHNLMEHRVRLHVWYRLQERGYGIPFPIRTVEHVNLPRKQERMAKAAATDRQTALRAVPLLAPLTDDQHNMLAAGATDLRLAPQQVLFRQNDPGESFYVIRRGNAEVVVENGSNTTVVATLGPGDFFGEMSALTGQPRSATIRAASALTLVQISKPDLQAIVDADATILEKISAIITQRRIERDAALHGLQNAPTSAAIQTEQKTLLSRMLSFFRKKQHDVATLADGFTPHAQPAG
jgi:small-conductance mechanosensitive channel/CRP-like cAMP-binding protein